VSKERLAIQGGPKAVPDGEIRGWPEITERDRLMVQASLAGGTHSFGPNCRMLQDEFARWNGNKHALATNSGTAALHMGLAAGGMSCGDEVLVPAYTWSSSATCVMHHNCIPIFVDNDFRTMNMDVDRIEAAITPKTRAIIPVHLHGLPMDMDRVMDIAKRHNLFVIEDCCQAHGATWKGRKVGTFGHCAAFSTNQNKLVCSGEGGAFVTDDDEILERAQKVWYFGETHDPDKKEEYHVYALGWMYRMADMTAAFARSQLMDLDRNLKSIAANVTVLAKALAGTPNLVLPEVREGEGHNWYNYTMRFDMKGLGHEQDARAFRDKLVVAMQSEGVQTGVWQDFALPDMTLFRARNAYGHGCPWSCPHARRFEYDRDAFPVARLHANTHTGMTVPIRHPNGPRQAELTAKGIRKIMENVKELG